MNEHMRAYRVRTAATTEIDADGRVQDITGK